MVDLILPLPGLSPVAGKEVVARFDGGRLSSEGGLLVLREIERRLSVDRLAACIDDPRDPGSTVHTLSDIVRFRLLMIAVGLRRRQRRARPAQRSAVQDGARPGVVGAGLVFAVDHLPAGEPAREANAAAPGPGDLYCASFRQVPRRITLDIDDTFDAVHGGQQLRLFNAHYDDYGFQPIVVFDGEGRFVTTVLRPAKRPKSSEIRAFLRRLVRTIRAAWPQVESCCAPTAITPAPRCSTGARRTVSTTASARPRPAR